MTASFYFSPAFNIFIAETHEGYCYDTAGLCVCCGKVPI